MKETNCIQCRFIACVWARTTWSIQTLVSDYYRRYILHCRKLIGRTTNNIHMYASANKALHQLIYTGTTFSFEQFWLPRDGGQSRTLGSTPLNCTPHVLHGWFSLRINAVGQRASAAFTALQYSTLSYNPLELFPDRAPRSQCEAKAPQTRNIPRSLQKFSLFPGLD